LRRDAREKTYGNPMNFSRRRHKYGRIIFFPSSYSTQGSHSYFSAEFLASYNRPSNTQLARVINHQASGKIDLQPTGVSTVREGGRGGGLKLININGHRYTRCFMREFPSSPSSSFMRRSDYTKHSGKSSFSAC